MGFDHHEPEQRQRLVTAMERASVSPGALWPYYLGIGGSVGELEAEAYLQGMLSIPTLERDLLAMAANELINDLAGPHAPYSEEVLGDSPAE
ncbi:hypothetical protein [Arthrobacter sp. fls2-241-R2A-200]|uniref:hypothetical protein n=1 Tax=Arthrobacter sp. fls2-241-R2A-200 TaxID=3040281 RepID=UPI00254C0199|nr:hypothetical protein [Arthrobacter sp. fls2-241-R2A-200]